MAEQETTAQGKRKPRTGPYEYLVCRVEEGRLVPLTRGGQDAPKGDMQFIAAKSAAKARAQVFGALTNLQPAETRDEFTIDLVSIRADNIGHQKMAWNVKREVAR